MTLATIDVVQSANLVGRELLAIRARRERGHRLRRSQRHGDGPCARRCCARSRRRMRHPPPALAPAGAKERAQPDGRGGLREDGRADQPDRLRRRAGLCCQGQGAAEGEAAPHHVHGDARALELHQRRRAGELPGALCGRADACVSLGGRSQDAYHDGGRHRYRGADRGRRCDRGMRLRDRAGDERGLLRRRSLLPPAGRRGGGGVRDRRAGRRYCAAPDPDPGSRYGVAGP